ncbi:MAG: hypothetical protein MJE68_25370 [Proteobacteria bacterium]|nr:hypothetical protein [Pseudomonadota bacterium]
MFRRALPRPSHWAFAFASPAEGGQPTPPMLGVLPCRCTQARGDLPSPRHSGVR